MTPQPDNAPPDRDPAPSAPARAVGQSFQKGSKRGSGWLFWVAIFPLVVAPVGTCAVVASSYVRAAVAGPPWQRHQVAPPEASLRVDPRVAERGAQLCAAFKKLPAQVAPADQAAALWKALGLARAPDDPWGHPYVWQPWDRAVRTSGPDGAPRTPDDQLVRCED